MRARSQRCSTRLSLAIPALMLLSALAQPAWANGPPIHGETAFTTGLNGAAVRSFAKVVRNSGPGGEVTAFVVPVVVPYEVLDNKLVLGVALPLVDKQLDLSGGGERGSGFGIGDLTAFGKLNLFQKDGHQETFRVAAKLGLSIPTGQDDATDELGRMPAGLQRGTGAFDPSAMLIVTKLWRRFGLNADLGYTVNTEANGVSRGDSIRYDVAASFRVRPWVYRSYPDHQINLMLELNGRYTNESSMAGETDPDSGGHALFVSPGLQYTYGGTIVEASVQLPVPGATSLNGGQLDPDWTALAGVRWLII